MPGSPAISAPRRIPPLAVGLAIAPLVLAVVARPFGIVLPRTVYLGLHTAMELFVAAVAIATFVVQWFAAGTSVFREARARFLAAAFIAVALLEAIHYLVFPGMPGFLGPASTERAIYYWLAARIWTVAPILLALRMAPGSEHPLLRRRWLITANLLAVAALVAVDIALPADRAWFFVEGKGLTPLKQGLEYALAAAALAGVWLTLRWNGQGAGGPPLSLAAALGAIALSELCFTLYRHPYDLFNVLGHAYLLAGFWFLSHALFVASLLRPYRELEALRAYVEDELVVTIRRLERLQEQREDLLRAVSHDLRNPLQVLLLQAERLVRAGPEAPAVLRPIAAIRFASRRMERMLRDLADSTRLDAGPLDLDRQPVDLRSFLEQLLEVEEGVLETRRVVNAVPDDLPPVDADADRLDRILVNLVGNALKYSKGEVVVRAARDGAEVRIEVADRGSGIPSTDLPLLFERYYRGHRHEGQGLGLGLYIVKRLVEAHSGRVEVASAPGEGSVFTVRLPAASPAMGPAALRA
jgi:signal transduction histidine kinase